MPPPSPPEPRCPLCGDRAHAEYAPFCSRRCQDRDLLNWLGGTYAVPAEPVVDED